VTVAKLKPALYEQHDFFLADISDVAGKDDRHSMEHPFFSLKKSKDTTPVRYEFRNTVIEITPSSLGRPTMWDKDLLVYGFSQLVEGINRGRADSKNRKIRFTAHDFLKTTNRPINKGEYDRIEESLERLKMTGFKSNMVMGGNRRKEQVSWIDSWSVVERTSDGRMEAIEFTLSEWVFASIQAMEVLTINRDYFRLGRSLEKRLYEMARKHCGSAQESWTVSEDTLRIKSGSQSPPKEFARMMREVIADQNLPDYGVSHDKAAGVYVFYRTTGVAKVIGANSNESS